MFYVSHTRCQWRDVSETFGPWAKVWSPLPRSWWSLWQRNRPRRRRRHQLGPLARAIVVPATAGGRLILVKDQHRRAGGKSRPSPAQASSGEGPWTGTGATNRTHAVSAQQVGCRAGHQNERTGDFSHPFSLAEEVGFEPTVPVDTAVFETARFGRSRTPPSMSLPLWPSGPFES